MSDNDRLRIVVLEGSVLKLLALNEELAEALSDLMAWIRADETIYCRFSGRNECKIIKLIAKAKRGSSPTAPLTQRGE